MIIDNDYRQSYPLFGPRGMNNGTMKPIMNQNPLMAAGTINAFIFSHYIIIGKLNIFITILNKYFPEETMYKI